MCDSVFASKSRTRSEFLWPHLGHAISTVSSSNITEISAERASQFRERIVRSGLSISRSYRARTSAWGRHSIDVWRIRDFSLATFKFREWSAELIEEIRLELPCHRCATIFWLLRRQRE